MAGLLRSSFWGFGFEVRSEIRLASGLLQIDHKLENLWWRHIFTWRHRQFFWDYFVSLVIFSYLPKFHVNIITCFGVMTIFFSKGMIINPEIENSPIRVLPSIWRLGWVKHTRCGANVSNKMLLNATKCQGNRF